MTAEHHPSVCNHHGLAAAIISHNPVLISKISKSAQLRHDEVQRLIEEVIKFLNLIAFSNQQLTPSIMVDLAWHELILCTRYYHEFCDENWGEFIHHNPGGDQKKNNRNFQKTLILYKKYYGNVPVKFWGDVPEKACGSCESMSE